jgi:hypothetical protein
MSVYRFPASVKRKGQSTPQGPYHPDILREIGRLLLCLDPATARQRHGLELLSLGLELLEFDARPEVYRSEVADFDAHLDALEELAVLGAGYLAARKRLGAAAVSAFGDAFAALAEREELEELERQDRQRIRERLDAERAAGRGIPLDLAVQVPLDLSCDAFAEIEASNRALARFDTMLEELSTKNGGDA